LNRKTRGEGHPNTATTLHDLALIEATRSDFPSAESMFRQVLESHRKALGDRHPILATTLNNLSRVLREQKRSDEAAAALQDALDIARAAFGGDHQLVAIYSINLASLRLTQERPAAAEALLREALRVRVRSPQLVPGRRRTFLEDDWSIGATRSLLGASLVGLARYDEAEAVLLEARRDLDALPRPHDRELKATLARLAGLYDAWGKPDKASEYRALLGS
jgi:tetratricopeptide (TPR) repeat protein